MDSKENLPLRPMKNGSIIHVVCAKETERLRYVLELLFSELPANPIPYAVYTSANEVEEREPTIFYGLAPERKGLYIPNAGLLEESGLERKKISVKGKGKDVKLFPMEGSEWPDFDLFSAVFWLVSRYEEYLPGPRDSHGRFAPKHSLAFKHEFLQLPIVNIWARELLNRLEALFPWLVFPPPHFDFLSTLDIDNGFKFEGKPLWRNMGGLALDLIKGAGEDFKNRQSLLLKKAEDPYDGYFWIRKQIVRYHIRVRIFVLASPKSKYDHGLPPNRRPYKKLIKRLKKIGPVSLHPSYSSYKRPDVLEREKQALAAFIRNEDDLKHVRRHFLKMDWPDWVHEAGAAGFSHDYSLGYAHSLGYRAGIAHSFYAFDPRTNKQLPLRIHPFALMETVFRYHQVCSPKKAWEITREMMETLSAYGGCFSSIWHDRSFAREAEALPWKKLYKKHLKLAMELMAENQTQPSPERI